MTGWFGSMRSLRMVLRIWVSFTVGDVWQGGASREDSYQRQKQPQHRTALPNRKLFNGIFRALTGPSEQEGIGARHC